MMQCRRARTLFAAPSAPTEADRMWLEDHLGRCASCRGDDRERRALLALVEAVPPPALGGAARERALERALGAVVLGAIGPAGPARARRWRSVASLVAAALVAAAATTAWWISRDPARGGAGRPPFPGADRLASGDLATPHAALAAGAVVPADTDLVSATGAELELGPARVGVAAAARVRWNPGSATLTLNDGRVTVDVLRSAPHGFRVSTARFVAEVAGTAFEVDPGGVRVVHGVVRVRAPDGQEVALLRAGESYRADALRTPEPAEKAGAPAAPAGGPLVGPAETAALLREARSALARGDVATAGARLETALAGPLEPSDEAEARTLLGDAALVAGRPDEAVELYLEVARLFRGAPAAESALYGAARTAAGAGRTERARALLHEYLERHPDGRFRAEAVSRLRALETEAP